MERIAHYKFDDDFPEKTVSLCMAQTLEELPTLITPSGPHFVLLIAMDATEIRNHSICAVAERLLDRGAIYVCAWGPECRKVEDAFDEAIVQRNPDETDRNVVFTTAHSQESIEEAVWFFLNCAWPAEDYVYTCSDWIAAVIKNPALEAEVRKKLLAEKEEGETS
ncbi:MAG: hypothetical protein LAO78_26360 [Acidobacteriia bacterium]|nr:hypothetical protein [Terriglobia bacterium]